MKTHQKVFRIIVPILLLLASWSAKAAVVHDTITLASGNCIPVIDSVYNGILITRIDSFSVISAPGLGNILVDSNRISIVYCAGANQSGTDNFTFYSCMSVSGIQVCDTVVVHAIITSNCTLSIGLVQDSSICPGGNRSFAVVSNGIGTATYAYAWSTGATTSSSCEPGPGQSECVTVTDANGCTGTACSNNANPCYLVCTMSIQNVCPSSPGIGVTVVGGTPPYTYYWSNGMVGSVICGLMVNYIYNVTVTDANGCSTSDSIFLGSVGNNCSFTFIADSTNNIVYFTSHPDTTHTVASYTWDFGDNTTGSGANPTHTYAAIGIYTASVYILYTNGDSCYAYNTISVHDTSLPCNSFAISLIPDYNNMCTTTQPAYQIYVTSPGIAPYSYRWSDGWVSNVDCPTTGVTLCATVTDSRGCATSACVNTPNNGGCSFTYSNDPTTNFTYFYPSTDSALVAGRYSWYWGDGTYDTIAHPSHQYGNGPGFFTVTMTVYYTNGDSCSYTSTVTTGSINNTPYCQAYFYNYIDSFNNNTFHFFDYSSYNPVSRTWDFGDGTTSTLQNPVHTYTTAGIYNVCLSTVDSSGCTSNYCTQVSNIPVQDLEAYLYHETTVTPGFPVWVDLGYYNAGTIDMSGTIQYRYPVGTTINAAGGVMISNDVTNRLATFSFSNLLPGSSDNIHIDLDASASLVIGSIAEDTMWINPIVGDVTPTDNVSFINDSVTGSWDPNAKAVSPKGEGREGIVPISTSDVSYMIHFQNTGNGPANKVTVIDTLDSNIDWSTVQETAASHDHVTQLTGNILNVTFHNINLPDSSVNFAGSQGYITLRAKLKPSLTSGTRITNTASIYFDFNAPVKTNTVVTTLQDKTSGIGSINRFDFALVPNPASSMVTLRGDFAAGSLYEVVNQLGQILLTGEVKANSTNLNISQLGGGIYLVKVFNGDKVGIKRLTVTR